jgi:hypothetical protein
MAPLPSASEILEHHYKYELDMLEDTYDLIRETQIKHNAFIESFCIHARNLIEFFRGDGRQYVECYTPFAAAKSRIKKLKPLLSQQIAHLDIRKRTVDNDEKISNATLYELIDMLAKESVEFRKHLKVEYRGMSIRSLDTLSSIGPSGSTLSFSSSPSGMTGPALAIRKS